MDSKAFASTSTLVKGKGKGRQHDDHGHSHVATAARIPLTASLPDPRKPFFQETQKPFDGFFPGMKNAFDLAYDMGVKPSTQ